MSDWGARVYNDDTLPIVPMGNLVFSLPACGWTMVEHKHAGVTNFDTGRRRAEAVFHWLTYVLRMGMFVTQHIWGFPLAQLGLEFRLRYQGVASSS